MLVCHLFNFKISSTTGAETTSHPDKGDYEHLNPVIDDVECNKNNGNLLDTTFSSITENGSIKSKKIVTPFGRDFGTSPKIDSPSKPPSSPKSLASFVNSVASFLFILALYSNIFVRYHGF